MTDLEIVLMIAWLVTLYLWRKAYVSVIRLRRIIVEVGLKEARIEIDRENHIVHIINK